MLIAVAERQPNSIKPILILLLILMMIGSGILLIEQSFSHGDQKHEAEAQRARDCLNNNGPDWVIKFKKSKRAIQYCYDPRTHELFIRVAVFTSSKIWQEITAYKKAEFFRTVEDAFREVLFDLGKDGYFSYVKPAWEDLNIDWGVIPILLDKIPIVISTPNP